MTDEYLPRMVQGRVDELTGHGEPPVVVRTGNTYELTHGNDRVRLMCRYVRDSRGKFQYTSTLSVDGVDRPRVKSLNAYLRLLADPDNDQPDRRPDCELPPVYPLADGKEVPLLVATMAEIIGAQDVTASVRVGHASMAQRKRWSAWTWSLNDDDAFPDEDAYVVEGVKDDGTRVQLYFHPHPRLHGMHCLSGVSAVDSQGRDLTGEFGEDINKALDGLLGVKVPSQASLDKGPSRPAGDSKGTVSNAVRTRKATVFRI